MRRPPLRPRQGPRSGTCPQPRPPVAAPRPGHAPRPPRRLAGPDSHGTDSVVAPDGDVCGAVLRGDGGHIPEHRVSVALTLAAEEPAAGATGVVLTFVLTLSCWIHVAGIDRECGDGPLGRSASALLAALGRRDPPARFAASVPSLARAVSVQSGDDIGAGMAGQQGRRRVAALRSRLATRINNS